MERVHLGARLGINPGSVERMFRTTADRMIAAPSGQWREARPRPRGFTANAARGRRAKHTGGVRAARPALSVFWPGISAALRPVLDVSLAVAGRGDLSREVSPSPGDVLPDPRHRLRAA